MQPVPPTIPPLWHLRQPIPPGRFRAWTAHTRPPVIRPSMPPPSIKRVVSAAVLTGEAGSNLVLSRLQSWGIPGQPAMASAAYDLIADVPGHDMVRIQVKTISRPKGQRCSYAMARGFYYSKAGTFPYGDDDYDLAAFACLSLGQVFFCAGPVHRITVRATWLRSAGIDRETFELALNHLQRRRRSERSVWQATLLSNPAALPATQQTLPF